MHTINVIAAGLFICAGIMLLSKLWTTTKPLTGAALSIFLAIWLTISVASNDGRVKGASFPRDEM